ncbi:MAG: transporter substrate-binding domain-containing protein, partial [Spirochaetes bacterium]|nr:transporter substrate-binding domain-containing protein [Spirochaetota bacterium]
MVRRVFVFALILVVGLAFVAFAGGQSEEPAAADQDAAAEEAGSGGEAAEETALERTPQDPRLHEPGQLTVATGDPVYPPWMLNDDPASGEGFENGLVYALAEEMGFDRDDVVWVTTTFDQGIAPGDKPYDFVIQQYSVTEERREFVD